MSVSVPPLDAPQLGALRARIARIERRGATRAGTPLRFGLAAIDQHLPGGGLASGALHELAGDGPGVEHATAATLLAAGLLARRRGPVLWAFEQRDLFAPALAAAGLHPDRVIFAEAGRAVLATMEEALHHTGLAAVVGEVRQLGLTASRRLGLAAEASGVPAFALRRSRSASDPALSEVNAAATRWRVGALPALPLPDGVPGIGRALWRLDLVRCRGGVPATWIVEACDAKGRLSLAADIGDRPAAPPIRRATG